MNQAALQREEDVWMKKAMPGRTQLAMILHDYLGGRFDILYHRLRERQIVVRLQDLSNCDGIRPERVPRQPRFSRMRKRGDSITKNNEIDALHSDFLVSGCRKVA